MKIGWVTYNDKNGGPSLFITSKMGGKYLYVMTKPIPTFPIFVKYEVSLKGVLRMHYWGVGVILGSALVKSGSPSGIWTYLGALHPEI